MAARTSGSGTGSGASPVVVTATSATLETRITQPFSIDPVALTSTLQGVSGEYTDAESGLQYLRARYYDPATAQFLTRDPIDHITGDPYGYVNGNPNSYTDPTGQFGFAIPVVVAGGVALGIAACYLFCPDPPTPSLSVPDWMTINPLIPAVGLLVSPFSDSNDDAYSEPCGQWADDHLPSIGGSKERITPGGGAPVLGERDGRPSGADPWFHHDVIVKDGRVYDEANPNGVPTGEYEKQWEHPDGTNFPW